MKTKIGITEKNTEAVAEQLAKLLFQLHLYPFKTGCKSFTG